MKTGKALLGIVAGVAIGIAAGILIAPDKGSSTRKKMYTKGNDFADLWKVRVNSVLEAVTEKLDCMREDIHQLTEKSKTKQETDGMPTKIVRQS